jgi:transcriptional regulator with XRE-family HTH domain
MKRTKKPPLHPIAKARTEAGMSRTELARQSGISAAYVNLLESGRRTASDKVRADIAEALKCTPGSLLTTEQIKIAKKAMREVSTRFERRTTVRRSHAHA